MNDKSYKNNALMSDRALAEQIGRFVKEKRIEQNKTQDTVANAAGISRSTLSLLEKGETVTIATLLQVLRVLDQLQVLDVFSIQSIMSPIQLAKLESKKRKRVSRVEPTDPKKSTW